MHDGGGLPFAKGALTRIVVHPDLLFLHITTNEAEMQQHGDCIDYLFPNETRVAEQLLLVHYRVRAGNVG